MSTEKDIDFVLRTVEKRDIRFVQLWFTDVLGNLALRHLARGARGGLRGGHRLRRLGRGRLCLARGVGHVAFPDPATFALLPWRLKESGVARVFCDVPMPSREPFEGDPRRCLRKVFAAPTSRASVSTSAPRSSTSTSTTTSTLCRSTPLATSIFTPMDRARTTLRCQTTLTLEKMSILVQYSYHAAGLSQNGVELRSPRP